MRSSLSFLCREIFCKEYVFSAGVVASVFYLYQGVYPYEKPESAVVMRPSATFEVAGYKDGPFVFPSGISGASLRYIPYLQGTKVAGQPGKTLRRTVFRADMIGFEQKKYLKDKAELDSEIKKCRKDPALCSAAVRDFVKLLDDVAAVHVDNPKSDSVYRQMTLIDAWVNLRLDYDNSELDMLNFGHRSLLGALRDRKGVCDEMARLKLYAAEYLIEHGKTSLKANDVHWLGEVGYLDGVKNYSHAVMVFNVRPDQAINGNRTWILNDKEDNLPAGQPLSRLQSDVLICEYSMIESAANHLNFTGSQWNLAASPVKDRVYVLPDSGFNSTHAGEFNIQTPLKDKSNVPAEALHGNPEARMAIPIGDASARRILASAFSGHRIVDVSPTPTRRDPAQTSSIIQARYQK